jgi:hypothetical protein
MSSNIFTCVNFCRKKALSEQSGALACSMIAIGAERLFSSEVAQPVYLLQFLTRGADVRALAG